MRTPPSNASPIRSPGPRGPFATAVILGVVVLAGCHSDEPPPPSHPGAVLYREWDCALCHGSAREGSELGPPLDSVAAEWSADDLADYLRDPASAMASRPRLRELQTYYPEARMPAYDYPEARRLALARWLLEPAPAGQR